MKNTFIFMVLALSISTLNQADCQNATFQKGERSVAIIANPVFGYLGNMFDDNTFNTLNLNSAGVVFRKFSSNNRAFRFSFNVDLSGYTSTYIYPTSTVEYFDLRMGLNAGKEYRKNFTNLSVYGGWLVGGFITESRRDYTYLENPDMPQERPIQNNLGSSIGFSAGGFLGTEYYFSPNFFVGIELIMTASWANNFNQSIVKEKWIEQGSNLVRKVETENIDDSSTISLSNENPILFFVGVKF